ncbi:hypothetical protein PVE90_14000 [Pseudomonas carnis]|nr:hypothetical protein [Pseudomonas carnis]
MSNYMYKTTAPTLVAAVIAWSAKRITWNTQRDELSQVFDGALEKSRARR